MSPKASKSGDLYVKYGRSFHLSFSLCMSNWRKPTLQACVSVSTSEFLMGSVLPLGHRFLFYERNTNGVSMSALLVVPKACRIQAVVFPGSRSVPEVWLTCTSLTWCIHLIGKHICYTKIVGLFQIKALYCMQF